MVSVGFATNNFIIYDLEIVLPEEPKVSLLLSVFNKIKAFGLKK
jgi:hypothetical protein